MYQRALCELGLLDESYDMTHIKVRNYASAKPIIENFIMAQQAKYSKKFFFNNVYLFVFFWLFIKKSKKKSSIIKNVIL